MKTYNGILTSVIAVLMYAVIVVLYFAVMSYVTGLILDIGYHQILLSAKGIYTVIALVGAGITVAESTESTKNTD